MLIPPPPAAPFYKPPHPPPKKLRCNSGTVVPAPTATENPASSTPNPAAANATKSTARRQGCKD